MRVEFYFLLSPHFHPDEISAACPAHLSFRISVVVLVAAAAVAIVVAVKFVVAVVVLLVVVID